MAPDGAVLEFDDNGNRISWLRSESRFLSDLAEGEARFVRISDRWSVQFKQREPEGKKPRSILVDQGTTSSGSSEVLELFGKNVFDNPKPKDLIAYLVSIVTGHDDYVLDFFSGSGTTAHAVMAQNCVDGIARHHIQVQLPEPTPEKSIAREAGFDTIAEVSRKRIDLAGKAIAKASSEGGTEALDVGYRTYVLSETNFSKWSVASVVDRNQLEQHLFDLRESSSADDVTADDLLAEILLKQGYSLTEQIAPVDVAGLELRSVGNGIVLAYLNEHVKPTLEQLRAVVDEDPARLIVLEDAFQGDDQLKTNLAQLCKSRGIELWTA